MRYRISIHKNVVEVVIHITFWIGVYYVLSGLIAASFNMVVYRAGIDTGGFSGHMLFPYPWPVLGILMLLFYGNIFGLFKKLLRAKKNFKAVLVIAGWFVLLFTINFLVVRMLAERAAPAKSHMDRALEALPKFQKRLAIKLDTTTFQVDSVRVLSRIMPDNPMQPPPIPPKMEFTVEDWQDMQMVMGIIFLAVLGMSVGYIFIKEWVRNDITRNQLEAYQLNTEVKFLKSQINPHFLFNTLNNLYSMAQEKGNDGLADGIYKLSGMMRYMIYDSNAPSVPLNKEIEYLQDCIALNKLRYADEEVKVIFNYPAHPGNVTVTPMLFIPFVENAFKHGVMIGCACEIDIDIRVTNEKLIFTCVNTNYSTVKKMDVEKSGIGLENVKRRLGLLYAGKHNLQIVESDGKFSVTLEIELA